MHLDLKQLEIGEILEKIFFGCAEISFPFRESWQQSEAFTILCLSSHIATAHRDTGKGWMASGHAGLAARVSRWAVSLWDLQNLQCFEILLLSFLLSSSITFLFCFLILTMHSDTQRSSGHRSRAGLAVSLCACRPVHAHAWQDDHVSSKTATVDDNSSGIYERKCENWRTAFPCFSRKNSQCITRDKVL